jgi:hypothetical protein
LNWRIKQRSEASELLAIAGPFPDLSREHRPLFDLISTVQSSSHLFDRKAVELRGCPQVNDRVCLAAPRSSPPHTPALPPHAASSFAPIATFASKRLSYNTFLHVSKILSKTV